MLSDKRPWAIRAYNFLGLNTKLQLGSLLQKAQAKSGLKDFGPEDIETPLAKLLYAINNEANLHPFGQFITRERIVNVLMNRLRAQELFKKHPAILDTEIKAPIVITGLQRTGTTRLHRLLSVHPQVRSLQSWEALNPAPMEGDTNNKKRLAFAKTAERALRFMSPDFFAIHPVEHEAPEEDILLNDMSFISTVPEATMWVPSYAKYVQEQSHEGAYNYLKKMLQLLTWQQKGERWVLKTPQYMEFLPEAKKVFPDMKLMHTYRDPLKVIPSFSSMLYHSYRVFSDRVEAEKVARHWFEKDTMMASKALRYFSDSSNEVLQVSYYDMMSNTEEQMRQIYSFTNLAIDEEVLRSFQTINQKNRQHKYGVHQYSLDDFGITKEEVNAAFQDYRNKIEIPYE